MNKLEKIEKDLLKELAEDCYKIIIESLPNNLEIREAAGILESEHLMDLINNRPCKIMPNKDNNIKLSSDMICAQWQRTITNERFCRNSPQEALAFISGIIINDLNQIIKPDKEYLLYWRQKPSIARDDVFDRMGTFYKAICRYSIIEKQ